MALIKKTCELFSRVKLESLKDQKDSDIFGLREQCQRLQVQLNQGHSGFSEFKEKKTKEIDELKAHIDEIKVLNDLTNFSNKIIYNTY